MKKILIIDWILIPLFLLSAFTGVKLHMAGHGSVHEIWHNWAVRHIIASILFLILIIYHIMEHKAWYKSLLKKGVGKKRQATIVVSVIFIITSLTGLALFAVDGANSSIGLWHYKLGLVASMIFLGHIIKRIPILCKSLHIK